MSDTETPTDGGGRHPTDLPSLAAAIARARGAEVPSYAPHAFREALDTWDAAATVAGDEARQRRALERAVETLADAETKAHRAADVLREVAQHRTETLRGDRERYYAPAELVRAEAHYRAAVDHAEAGDLDAAGAEADAANAAFREATLRSLEFGPIAAIENAVDEAADATSSDALRAAKAEVADIRRALDDTRHGETGVAELSRRISIGRGRIGAGLGDVRDPTIIDPLYPGDDLPWPQKPTRVDTIRVVGRTADALTVTWLSPRTSAVRHVLLRQRESGPWIPVAEFGPLEGWATHTDTGLDPETLYCYRVQSENDRGVVATAVDKRAGGYTRAVDGIGVWRVQLAIRTADVSDAGTSDPIQVRLNSPLATFSPNGNQRWLDYGPRWEGGFSGWVDDFARGREFVYDLDQGGVRQLADITMLTIAKEGTDAVGIAEIRLLVNNAEVFSRVFGETSATCLWIDGDDGHQPQHTIWHGELRAHPKWQAFLGANHQPPARITNAELVDRIEGLVGHAIHGTEARWGEFHSPAWVEVTFVDAERLHVDLDLEAVMPILANPEVDIDFDLRFSVSCDPAAGTATLNITTENFDANVDFPFLTELFGTILTLGQFGRIENYIAERIAAAFEPITQSILLRTGGLCPVVTVQPNGEISLSTS